MPQRGALNAFFAIMGFLALVVFGLFAARKKRRRQQLRSDTIGGKLLISETKRLQREAEKSSGGERVVMLFRMVSALRASTQRLLEQERAQMIALEEELRENFAGIKEETDFIQGLEDPSRRFWTLADAKAEKKRLLAANKKTRKTMDSLRKDVEEILPELQRLQESLSERLEERLSR